MISAIIKLAFTFFFLFSLAACSPLMQGRDLGNPASVADAPDPVIVTESTRLSLNAAPLKATVELGEPVYLAVLATNTTQRELVRIIGDLRPGAGFIEVFIIGPDQRSRRLAPLSDSDFETSITVAPGKRVGDVFPIFFDANGWVFTKPGTYGIYTRLRVPESNGYATFRSESVVVNVTPSEAGLALVETDQQIGMEAGKFLLWRSGDHLKAGQDHLQSIVEQYPDAPLSAYIRAAFARSYSEPFANYAAGKVRPPDCARAERLRGEVDYKTLTENLRIEDAMSQAKCFAQAERWGRARDALQAAMELAGERPEFANLARAVAKMQRHLEQAAPGHTAGT